MRRTFVHNHTNHHYNHHLSTYIRNTFTSIETTIMHLSFHENKKTRRNQDNEQMNVLKTLNKKVKGRRNQAGVFSEYPFIVGCTSNMAGASTNTLYPAMKHGDS